MTRDFYIIEDLFCTWCWIFYNGDLRAREWLTSECWGLLKICDFNIIISPVVFEYLINKNLYFEILNKFTVHYLVLLMYKIMFLHSLNVVSFWLWFIVKFLNRLNFIVVSVFYEFDVICSWYWVIYNWRDCNRFVIGFDGFVSRCFSNNFLLV